MTLGRHNTGGCGWRLACCVLTVASVLSIPSMHAAATDPDPVLQRLNAAWKDSTTNFSASLSGNGHQFRESVATGVRSNTHGGKPPLATNTPSFDPFPHVLLQATNADPQMLAYNQIAVSYVEKLESGLLADLTGNVSALFADGLSEPFAQFTEFLKEYESSMVLMAGYGGTFQGGGGLGFGFNVLDCKQNVVLTMTGAINWGFILTTKPGAVNPTVTAGVDGGASVFMGATSEADGTFSTVLGVGGGGGGTLVAKDGVWTPAYTASAIDNQTVTHDGDLDKIFEAVHSSACAPLTLVGGGGGGGGFLAENPDPGQDMNYGASSAYSYSSDGTSEFVLIDDDTDDDDSGGQIGSIIAQCRKQCMVSGVPGGSFYPCFCACLKRDIAIEKLQWPHKIVCTTPSGPPHVGKHGYLV